MIILDEVVHINPFSELVNSIEKDGPISIIDIGNKLKKLKITWTEDNLRQLATNNRITSKRKFMVLETLTQNDDLWEGVWILLEYFFDQTILDMGVIENQEIVEKWIGRNLKRLRGNMGELSWHEYSSDILLKYGVRQNGYIREKTRQNVNMLLSGSTDDCIVSTCRLLTLGNYLTYSQLITRDIAELARLGRDTCVHSLQKYIQGNHPGAPALLMILETLWLSEPDYREILPSSVISVIGLGK